MQSHGGGNGGSSGIAARRTGVTVNRLVRRLLVAMPLVATMGSCTIERVVLYETIQPPVQCTPGVQ